MIEDISHTLETLSKIWKKSKCKNRNMFSQVYDVYAVPLSLTLPVRWRGRSYFEVGFFGCCFFVQCHHRRHLFSGAAPLLIEYILISLCMMEIVGCQKSISELSNHYETLSQCIICLNLLNIWIMFFSSIITAFVNLPWKAYYCAV